MAKYFISFLILLSFSTSWALKPDKNYVAKPEDLSLRYTTSTITTSDGYALHSWTIQPDPANDKRTTLILTYGDSGNMSYWLNQAWVASNNGYTVVLFDYRGFGQSQDFTINNDYLYYNEFVTDLEAVIQWTKTKNKNIAQIKNGNAKTLILMIIRILKTVLNLIQMITSTRPWSIVSSRSIANR